MKTKISVYTKGGIQAATTYYRIVQYLNKIDCHYSLNTMLSECIYKRYMPVSKQNIIIKVAIFLYIYFRVLWQLLRDLIHRPDILIVSRRFINRFFPTPYKLILNNLKRSGTTIVWDFDDNVIVSKELTKKGFDYMSNIANHILIASPYNINLVRKQNKDKIIILPTTDGDMFIQYNKTVHQRRLESFKDEIRLIWVGTSVSLCYLERMVEALINSSSEVLSLINQKIIITVVCDKPLNINININNAITIRNIKWERNVAINEMLNSHIGIMPLENTDFTKGKGGFKLIQYLSVALPIIGSSVGINSEIITPEVGVAVDKLDSSQWAEAIMKFAMNVDKWNDCSLIAMARWQSNFNFEDNLNFWNSLLSN
ncbi:MAG: glycosyltransferase [Prevotella sp.]|nr:glycosyltransferase [Bacteroides sp.]MCM1366396.1 glycosyltransferase [Prevotella sp.]MCM1436675.1 glycosyltransferase [Prevotella sp.]